MTQQIINLGPTNNPSSGDTIRVALTKSNSNFTELYLHTVNYNNPHETTAAQVGAVPTSYLGVANGVATLDSSGVLTASQLPAGGGSSINLGATVSVSNLSNNQILVYSATSTEWSNTSQNYSPTIFSNSPSTNIGEVVGGFCVLQNAQFAASFAGSFAKCLTAPTSNVTFAIFQNSSNIGTLTFNSGSLTGTFVSSGIISLLAGDIVYIAANSTDTSMANLFITFSGILT